MSKAKVTPIKGENKALAKLKMDTFDVLQQTRRLAFETQDRQEEQALTSVEEYLKSAIKRIDHQLRKQ